MIPNPYLERLVSLDTCAEILAVMKPRDFVIVLLRCAGWSDRAISETLHISRRGICAAGERLEQHIAEAYPELRSALAGRTRTRNRAHRYTLLPLAEDLQPDLTVSDAGRILGAAP